ncbi:MAG: hypothetical protein WC024_10660 [Shewanella sp.]|jgi:hypothetical protein|uniref:hypothetical protein n=1 Tax=unclassified Shewanella TaxID=196818 RepID=UPI0021D91A13|nr:MULTISPECIES: hypothetical protein [unclassified Shewanella]MCU8034749.1 hypothetical protein [Shewanella sp. SM71]MCU8096618.1 hypothetical protein [Shewanella sp. SM102]
MKINIDNIFLTASSQRELWYYFIQLNFKLGTQYQCTAPIDFVHFYEYLRSTHQITPQELAKLKETFEKEGQLQPDEFKWLDKKEERFWNWAWSFLKVYSQPNSYPSEQGLHAFTGYPYGYHMDNFKSNYPIIRIDYRAFDKDVTDLTKRIEQIKLAFKSGEADLQSQREIIQLIHNLWKPIFNNKIITKWLEIKDQIQVDWVWDYLQALENPPHKNTLWLPSTDAEKYSAIVSFFDLIEEDDTKQLITMKIKKAWSQKKFRDKSEGKKAYSISMSTKTKTRLNQLADHYDLKITDIIDKLIQDAHKTINN